jgi:hypothetical protein
MRCLNFQAFHRVRCTFAMALPIWRTALGVKRKIAAVIPNGMRSGSSLELRCLLPSLNAPHYPVFHGISTVSCLLTLAGSALQPTLPTSIQRRGKTSATIAGNGVTILTSLDAPSSLNSGRMCGIVKPGPHATQSAWPGCAYAPMVRSDHNGHYNSM